MKSNGKLGLGTVLGLILTVGAVLLPSAAGWHYLGGNQEQLRKIFGLGRREKAPVQQAELGDLTAQRAMVTSVLVGLAMAAAGAYLLRHAARRAGSQSAGSDLASQIALIAKCTDNAALLADAEGRIQWANDAFCQLTGYTSDELIGKTPAAMLQGPNSDPTTIEYMHTCRRAGEAFSAEIINYHKSGRPFWMQLDVTPVRDAEGAVTHFVSIQRDISQRKQHEQEICHYAQALRAAVQTKREVWVDDDGQLQVVTSELLSNVAHLHSPGTGEADYLKSIGAIERGGEQLIDRLDKEGSGTRDFGPCCLTQVLADIDTLARPQANEKGLFFSIDNEGPIPTIINSDTRLLRHALTCLVDNSLKFTSAGAVRVTCRLTTPADAEDAQLALDIVDTGIGLSTEQKHHLLTGDKASPTGAKNSLAICRRIAETLGGNLQCESEPGVGTIFTLIVATGPLAGVPTLDALRLGPTESPHPAPADRSPTEQVTAVHPHGQK